jgi:transposase
MWERLEPWLPQSRSRRGGRWRDHRLVIEAIAWRYRTGALWRDLPESFRSWQCAYTRFRNWTLDGTWAWLLTGVQAQADAAGELDWLAVAVDPAVCRAHQHVAGTRPGKGESASGRSGRSWTRAVPGRAEQQGPSGCQAPLPSAEPCPDRRSSR